MHYFDRIFLIVLDSVGIGELPDARLYDDLGADTLGHIAERVGGLTMSNMSELGLGHITPIQGMKKISSPKAHFGKMMEVSTGKDTTIGHWEIMGIKTEIPFKTYPNGFPDSLIKELEHQVGRKIIGNKPASGTEIIDEFGQLHMDTGHIIIYTSADSVLQIAAHEELIPLDELYKICEVSRKLTLNQENFVCRVIARPFIGKPGHFNRTPNRKDYSVKPSAPTVMNALAESGFASIAIGKISDIFAGEGVTQEIKTKSNMDGVDQLLRSIDSDFKGLCFVNLVDFDAIYGHRRDPEGYANALLEFDGRIPEILAKLNKRDLLMITADHGNDPTHHGTDHTREYVPLLVYHAGQNKGHHLGIRETFADVGATIAENFNVKQPVIGSSFLKNI